MLVDPRVALILEAFAIVFLFVSIRLRKSSGNCRACEIFRFTVEDWRLDLLFPAVLAVIVQIPFILNGVVINPYLNSFWGVLHSLLVAPIFEETFFRGVLIGGVLYIFKRLNIRLEGFNKYVWYFNLVAISSLIFFYSHYPTGLDVLAVGVFAGMFYLWRRSLVPSIIFHFFSNLVFWIVYTVV